MPRSMNVRIRDSRRGVELSMNLIIIIVIGLIVAALIIYIVAKNVGDADKDISGCAAKNGQCKSECDAGESGSAFFTGGCNSGEICCTKPLG